MLAEQALDCLTHQFHHRGFCHSPLRERPDTFPDSHAEKEVIFLEFHWLKWLITLTFEFTLTCKSHEKRFIKISVKEDFRRSQDDWKWTFTIIQKATTGFWLFNKSTCWWSPLLYIIVRLNLYWPYMTVASINYMYCQTLQWTKEAGMYFFFVTMPSNHCLYQRMVFKMIIIKVNSK